MAQYKIIAASVTGNGSQVFSEGETVDGIRLNAAHIAELVNSGVIEEVKEVAETKPVKKVIDSTPATPPPTV
jgi:hypothetical protein